MALVPKLSSEDWEVIRKVLLDQHVQLIVGGGEWSLTDEEETLFWGIVRRLKADG